jgi:hypothetical protein
MFTMQWPSDQKGCPRCSHPYAEVHSVGAENEWSGRCPNCGAQLFGILTFTVTRSALSGKARLCRITKPFSAVRYHDEAAERQFQIGEKVWFDADQKSGTVVFNVEDDPWIVYHEVLRSSIEIQN